MIPRQPTTRSSNCNPRLLQVCSYAFAAQYTLGYCSLPVFGPLLFGASYDVLTPLQAAQAGLAGDASLAVAIPAIVQLSVGAQLAVSSNSGAGAIGSGGTAGGMAEAASSSSSGSSNPSGNSNSPGTHAEGPRASQLASMDAGGSRWFRYEWNAGAALAAGGTAVVAIALNAAASLALAGGQAAQNTSQVRSVIDAAASAAAQASADGADSVIGSAAAVGDSDVAAVQLLLAAGAVLLAPIYEEYFYRGFLLPSLARRTGQPAAVAISAAAFAASHLSGGDALQLWLLGAALGGAYVTVGRGNLAVPTLAHALYNGAVFAALALRHA